MTLAVFLVIGTGYGGGMGGEMGAVTRDFELAPNFDRSPFDRPATPRSQQGIVLLVKHQGF